MFLSRIIWDDVFWYMLTLVIVCMNYGGRDQAGRRKNKLTGFSSQHRGKSIMPEEALKSASTYIRIKVNGALIKITPSLSLKVVMHGGNQDSFFHTSPFMKRKRSKLRLGANCG